MHRIISFHKVCHILLLNHSSFDPLLCVRIVYTSLAWYVSCLLWDQMILSRKPNLECEICAKAGHLEINFPCLPYARVFFFFFFFFKHHNLVIFVTQKLFISKILSFLRVTHCLIPQGFKRPLEPKALHIRLKTSPYLGNVELSQDFSLTSLKMPFGLLDPHNLLFKGPHVTVRPTHHPVS